MSFNNLKTSLHDFDIELYDLIVEEYNRQRDGIELIAS